ncbi:MAG: ABC transporter permease [Alphaproteobacteria bacterium]|nr:ABC transporter permease [Alphaproteobacteria bacterium]
MTTGNASTPSVPLQHIAAAISGAVFAFLVLPILVVVPLSFTAGELLVLPAPGFSLRWYELFFTDQRWLLASRNSLIVGVLATLAATALGTLAAIGLWLGSFRGRGLLLAVLALPLAVPAIISALALYFAFSAVGLANSLAGLVLGHTVLAAPVVVVTVLAQLRMVDRALLQAATSLGAGPVRLFRRVLLPLILPGVASGAVFAFATSFDDLMVALFLAGPGQFTLPREMYAGLREQLSPTICAAATVLVLVSGLLLGLSEVLRRRDGAGKGDPYS